MELEFINCDLCKLDNNTTLLCTRDYRYGHFEMFNIVKCNNCRLIYMNPRPTSESILTLYDKYYTPKDDLQLLPKLENKRLMMNLKKLWHKLNGQYIDEIISKAKGKVLDVGCGNGYLLLPLKDKGCEVYGVEINYKSVNVCNELGLKVFCGTLEDANFPDEFFDIVILSQVLEHLSSPKVSLRKTFRILKPSGKVFIYCPNANSYLSRLFSKYWHGWHLPFHFYVFTKDTIEKLAVETGFKINRISTITPDNFFIVSLKDYFFGEKNSNIRPIDRGKFFDSLFFRTVISPVFRLMDLLTQNGDCLKVELEK